MDVCMQVDARVTAVSYATQELSNLEHFIRTTQPSRPHAQALTVSLCLSMSEPA